MKTDIRNDQIEVPRSSRHLDLNHLLKEWWANRVLPHTSEAHEEGSKPSDQKEPNPRGVP